MIRGSTSGKSDRRRCLLLMEGAVRVDTVVCIHTVESVISSAPLCRACVCVCVSLPSAFAPIGVSV